MRLWSVHPRYLDAQGLVALWREALLARAVLRGETIGYRRHPQLHRFLAHRAPRSTINAYLAGVLQEADARGYRFDRSKVGPIRPDMEIATTSGQIAQEWRHLLQKLERRNPDLYRQWRTITAPEPHPLFTIVFGPVEPWERSSIARRRW